MHHNILRALVCGITFICFHINAVAAPPVHSAFELLQPSNHGGVELSPNGRYVAFIRRKTVKYCLDRYGQMEDKAKNCQEKKKVFRSIHAISVFDMEASKIVKSFALPENLLVSWLDWPSNDRLLINLVSPTTIGNSGRRYALGAARIISMPLHNNEYVVLFENQKSVTKRNRSLTQITNMLRTDPEHIIMPARKQGDLDLWKVNVITGHAELLSQGESGTFYWYTDNNGKPVLRFDCVGRRCRKINVFSTENAGLDWEKIKSFKVKPNEDTDDYDFWPIAPAPTKGQYYVLSNEGEDERRAIKLYDIKSKKFIKTIYKHPTVDVGGAFLNIETGAYAGAWFYEDRLNYAFEDAQLQKNYDALSKYFTDSENVNLLGFSANGTRAVAAVTSPNNSGEYYLYDMATKVATRLLGRYPDFAERFPTTTDILKIPMRDGQTITAYHTYAEGQKHANLPLLVMPHGGPEMRDYYDYDPSDQYFAQRGYQTLRINFRGSSGFGKQFAEAGYGEWGGIMQNDVLDATKHLYDKGIASPDNSCIVGYSYGGYVALYAGATTPDMFKCVVSGGGVSDILADMKQTRKDYGADSASYEYWLKSMGDPKLDKDKLVNASPVHRAEQFTAPVLLVHGEYDGIVDIRQSEKMLKALKKEGKPVEYLKLKDEGHSGWSLENEILYLETIESFLDKHLTTPNP